MRGLMQDWPLLCHRVIQHAAREHGNRRVVTRRYDGTLQDTNYAQIHDRALLVSKRLVAEGIEPGDRVGTVAASTADHMACWYGIAGIGAVYHPVNPRLFGEQIVFIINDAQDRILIIDRSAVPLMESLAAQLPKVERYVVLCDRAGMPQTTLRNAVAFEDWIGQPGRDYQWPTFDENTAASLAYTSGTTGNPKGVLYSHRSIVLMSLTANSPDMYGFSANDVVLQIAPMCHANGWTWPFSAPMVGASLIFPGGQLDGASLGELLVQEQVTCTGGVPTVWQTILAYLDERDIQLRWLKRVYVGGSPCPRVLIDTLTTRHGAEVRSSYGMTEMGPLGSICTLSPDTRDLAGDARIALMQGQGRTPFLVELQAQDDEGRARARDGTSMGHLKARGPCVVRAYYGQPPLEAVDRAGYFDSGDIAVVNAHGYVQITDRSKDLVKSGGEWISSIDLENHVMTLPEVKEAAVIGARHEKWDERPLLIVVLAPGRTLGKQAILDFLVTRVAKWWLPDDVVFVDEIAHTATGKVSKKQLREQYENYLLSRTPS